MTCSWLWFIHPETAISKNRNGSSTLCVFKTHYRYRRAAVAKHRIFMQIQFSYHTRKGDWVNRCSSIRDAGLGRQVMTQLAAMVITNVILPIRT